MNWQAFLAMDGYGPYVWSSFGLCFALMAIEVFRLRRRIRSRERKRADTPGRIGRDGEFKADEVPARDGEHDARPGAARAPEVAQQGNAEAARGDARLAATKGKQ